MTLRLATAGESHGPALVAIVTGLPAEFVLDREAIDADLARRQQGYGRSPRQRIEQDAIEVLAGLRHGRTLGTPLAFVIRNRDHDNWAWGMSPWLPEGEPRGKGTEPVTVPRPGHADLAGALKFGHEDVRDAFERASARSTAALVAAGSIAKTLLAELDVSVAGAVAAVGGASGAEGIREAVDDARELRDTLGGVVEVLAYGLPPGLGSHVHWDRRLDSRLAGALMGIQAIKAVEVGDGLETARRRGSAAHDEIEAADGGVRRRTTRSGGIEGGMSTGEPLRVRAAMKPISTVPRALATVDVATGEPATAISQRSDVCAVPAAGIVAEAMVALVLADAALEKFGGDSVAETARNVRGYLEHLTIR